MFLYSVVQCASTVNKHFSKPGSLNNSKIVNMSSSCLLTVLQKLLVVSVLTFNRIMHQWPTFCSRHTAAVLTDNDDVDDDGYVYSFVTEVTADG